MVDAVSSPATTNSIANTTTAFVIYHAINRATTSRPLVEEQISMKITQFQLEQAIGVNIISSLQSIIYIYQFEVR